MGQTRTVFERYSCDGREKGTTVILGTPLVKAVQDEQARTWSLMVTPDPDDGRWPIAHVSPPFATEAEALAFHPHFIAGPGQPVQMECAECGR